MNRKVNVIINCYNGEKYLKDAIDSVINQTYEEWEIIFWDNASTDKSKKILKEYDDKRIKYFYSKEHTSQYEARKRAVQKTDKELICFLDVDDWWESTKLESQVKLFNDLDVGFACSNYWIINERKNSKKIAFKNIPTGYVTNELLKKNFIGMSTLMIRRDCYFSLVPGFNPKFEIIGDYDLSLRLSLKYKLACTPDIECFYRWHGGNLGYLKFTLNMKELTTWIKDRTIENDEITKLRNFNYLKNYVLFYSGIACIKDNNRKSAFKKILHMNSPYFILKLIIVLSIPIALINKMRS